MKVWRGKSDLPGRGCQNTGKEVEKRIQIDKQAEKDPKVKEKTTRFLVAPAPSGGKVGKEYAMTRSPWSR